MKNPDRPAHPIECEIIDFSGDYKGLTKREHFAAMAMQGLISVNATYGGSTSNRASLTADAIAFADALLAHLDQSK